MEPAKGYRQIMVCSTYLSSVKLGKNGLADCSVGCVVGWLVPSTSLEEAYDQKRTAIGG